VPSFFPRTPAHLSGSPASEHFCAHAFAGVAPARRRTQVGPAPNTAGVGTIQKLAAGATIASRTREGTCVAKSKVKSMLRLQVVTSRRERERERERETLVWNPANSRQACRRACLYAHVHACTKVGFAPPSLLPTVALLTEKRMDCLVCCDFRNAGANATKISAGIDPTCDCGPEFECTEQLEARGISCSETCEGT